MLTEAEVLTDEFLDAAEVAAILGISRSATYKMVRQHKLPGFRFSPTSRRVLFQKSELMKYLMRMARLGIRLKPREDARWAKRRAARQIKLWRSNEETEGTS